MAPIACKDDKAKDEPATADKAAEKGEGGEVKAGAADGEADDGAKEPSADEGGGLVDLAQKAAGIVSGPREITPHYAKDLDPLLNLVPADADTFIIIRDISSIVDGSLGYLEASKANLENVAKEVEKEDPQNAKEMREGLAKAVEFQKALAGSGIDLSAGVVIAGKGDEKAVVVYGSAKADALPTLLTAVGAKDDLPNNCAPVASAAGYAVCTQADAAAYAPGTKAADLRRQLSAAMPGVDLDRANIVAQFPTDDGASVPFVVETGQGMAHVAFAVPQSREDLGKYLQAGRGAGLGLIGPGQPFVWAQGSTKEIEAAGKSAPPMAQSMVKTITGEFLAGGVQGVKGFAVLLGLTDPAPAAGLVALASMGLGEVPKELPDGTKITPTVETVRGVQAVRVKFEGGKQAKVFSDMGYASELFGFAAGHHAAITFGAGEEIVETIAKYTGTGPSQAMLDALPAPLAKAIDAGEPAFAMYVPFDAVQAQKTADVFKSVAAAVPSGEFGKSSPDEIMALFSDTIAPLSSAAMWISSLEDGPVFHIVIQGLAEVGTDEGRAALEAMTAVASGADRKATYTALAAKYPSSPRTSSYRARAGELGDPFSSVFVVAALGGAAGAALFGLSTGGGPEVTFEAPPPVPAPAPTPTPTPTPVE